jgi:hypothetical protein
MEMEKDCSSQRQGLGVSSAASDGRVRKVESLGTFRESRDTFSVRDGQRE